MCSVERGAGGVSPERHDVLLHRVQDVRREGEEAVFHFVGRGDPVAAANHHRRGVQFIEGELGDLGGHRLHGNCRVRNRRDDPAGVFFLTTVDEQHMLNNNV